MGHKQYRKQIITLKGSGVIRFVWSLCVRPSVRLCVCVKENHE